MSTANKTQTAHTPGPWLRNQYGHVYAMVPDAVFGMAAMGSREVCNMQENPNITADARLIAAAPEMLEALRELFDDVHKGRMVCKDNATLVRLHAAIAKATGGKS